MANRFDTDAPGDEDAIVAEINITPLTDIFLVLLVIFMVTSTAAIDAAVAESRGLRVDLPRASATGTLSSGDPVLTVATDGKLNLNGKTISPDEVHTQVEQALRDSGSERIVIRADQATLFGRAVEIMGEARKAGAKSIGVVAAPVHENP